jgi:RNA polymerase sigma-70 factor (sigma-E family)
VVATVSESVAAPTLAELFAAHYAGLCRLAALLVGDDALAEDVVQDAFMGLHRRWSGMRDPDRALAYLRSSVCNTSRSKLRRLQTARRKAPPPAPPSATVEQSAELAEEHRLTLAAVRLLPDRQRQVLVLRYWLDQSEAEIAETLGISAGAVKSHASRGLHAVEQMLAGTR